MSAHAVVVGGGLAGTTAALALADAGLKVTLAEGRPRLGGLAFSFRRGELTVDNGQHVFLRCCVAYLRFLDRIGARDLVTLQDRLDIPVLDAGRAARGRRGALRAGFRPAFRSARGAAGPDGGPGLGRLRRQALPVPLHLAASLATYPHLSLAERASVGRAALALRGLDPADPALDAVGFGSWLRGRGQSPRTIEALWDLVGVATLNATADDVSLGLAAMVFKTGLLSDPGAADIGWAAAPLGELHDDRARTALDRAGVQTLLRARATRIARAGAALAPLGPAVPPPHRVLAQRLGPLPGPQAPTAPPAGRERWRVEIETGPGRGTTLDADVVVLAVPQRETHALLPEGSLDDPGALLRIGTAPILNVHVVYDRQVTRRQFFAALGSPVQWVFDRTGTSGLTGGGQYLALSQSAAQDEIDLPVAELRARYLPELERLLPAARGAGVQDFFVTRERTATFAPAPGVGALRPGARTFAPGLYLAGAWTATGWPATMESAVRSGLQASRAAVTALGPPFDDDVVGAA